MSVAVCSAPGQIADMDNESFNIPTGKFTEAVHFDEFSLELSGGNFASKPTGENMVRRFAEIVDANYKYLLVDLEGCFGNREIS